MDGANDTQSSSAASTKRKGKQCAAFGCLNAVYGADGSPTHFHFFHIPRNANGATVSNSKFDRTQ